MFHLPAPQRFGMLEDPVVHALYLSISPDHTFDIDNTANLLSFFTSAIAARRARSLAVNNAEEHELLCRRLDSLLEGLKPLITFTEEKQYMSRFALTHSDPRPDNIILDETSGEVIGIVDWEYHGCMPACMAAGYPNWIRSPINESPIYRNPKSKMATFFLEPLPERNRLCDLYEKVRCFPFACERKC
jgi:aminoglycoside phosphotransferase (APT) family kinase protein